MRKRHGSSLSGDPRSAKKIISNGPLLGTYSQDLTDSYTPVQASSDQMHIIEL